MVSRSAGSLSWVFLLVLCAYYCSGQQDLIPTCDPLVNYLDNGYDFHKAVAHSDGSHVVAIEDGKQQLSYWDASTLNVSQSPQPAKSPFRLNTFTDSYAFDVPNNVLYYVSGLDWKVHVVMYGDFANVQELTAFPPTVSVTGIRQTNLHIFPLGLSQFLYYGFDYDNSESGLVQVFDITSPTAPSFVGNFSLNNRIMSAQVAFQGNYFYAGVSDSTDSLLSIYDLTSGPLAPTASNTISLGTNKPKKDTK